MKKKYLFTLFFILLMALSYLYIQYRYHNFRQMCEDTKINDQIAICSEDNWLDNHQKLLYLRSKNEYITGHRALVFYWDYSTFYGGTFNDTKKIIEISKKCFSVDPQCLHVYIKLTDPVPKEQFILYEQYLTRLSDICKGYVNFLDYRRLAKELNYPMKFDKKCY